MTLKEVLIAFENGSSDTSRKRDDYGVTWDLAPSRRPFDNTLADIELRIENKKHVVTYLPLDGWSSIGRSVSLEDALRMWAMGGNIRNDSTDDIDNTRIGQEYGGTTLSKEDVFSNWYIVKEAP